MQSFLLISKRESEHSSSVKRINLDTQPVGVLRMVDFLIN